MTISVGQMAVYYLTEHDVAELEHTNASVPHGPFEVGMATAALVTRVYGIQVLGESGQEETRTAYNLQVILDGENSIWRQDVPAAGERGGFLPAATVDLADFYARQVQPVIINQRDQIDALTRRLDALTGTPQGTHAADTPAEPITPAASGPVA